MTGYCPSSFLFARLWTETEWRSITSQKKNEVLLWKLTDPPERFYDSRNTNRCSKQKRAARAKRGKCLLSDVTYGSNVILDWLKKKMATCDS